MSDMESQILQGSVLIETYYSVEIMKVCSSGLGTLSAKEAKEYFSKLERHRVQFKYRGKEDDQSIILAFSKKKIGERKEWLRG